MSTIASERRVRRLSQAERSAATRRALLDSTIESLVELGYGGATMTEISERAGLSRGAQLHHFRTRAALFAAAAGDLAERVSLDLEAGVEQLPSGRGRVSAALDMIWALFTGPLFHAVLELSIHARTDSQLRSDLDPIEQLVGRGSLALLRRAFSREPEDPGLDDVIAVATATVRGLAILPLLEPGYDPTPRWLRCRERLQTLLGPA